MKFFGIVRSAANLLISRYVDNTLNTPNLDEAGNVGVNVVFSGGGGPFVIPFQTDDGSVPTGLVAPVYIPLNYGFNSGTGAWERNAKIIANTDDGTVPSAQLLQTMLGLGYAFNGTDWVRLQTNTAANQSADPQSNGLVVSKEGNWAITDAPAIGVTSTVTRAAVASRRHIITGVQAFYSETVQVTTAYNVTLTSGTVLFSGIVGGAAAVNPPIVITGLSIVCPVNTSVTLSFSGNEATSIESLSMQGYTVA